MGHAYRVKRGGKLSCGGNIDIVARGGVVIACAFVAVCGGGHYKMPRGNTPVQHPAGAEEQRALCSGGKYFLQQPCRCAPAKAGHVYAKLPALVFKGVYRHGVAAMHLLEQRQLEALCRRFQHLLAECHKHRVRKALYRPCHGARVDYLFGCIERIYNAHMAPLFALI